jgi:bifunctional NMN adenylyltransferase/nudix hydrolase
MKLPKVAVLYAPFQCVELPNVHKDLISNLLQTYDVVVCAVLVRRVCPTKNAPFNYVVRRDMLLTSFPSATLLVLPVPEERYPERQVSVLDSVVKSIFSERPDITLFAPTPFIAEYKKSKGSFQANALSEFLDAEALDRQHWKRFYLNMDAKNVDPKMTFRLGALNAMLSQYPISWSTIDIAIMRKLGKKTMLLLGKKPGENGWRFPGGFKDRGDVCFEDAVYREGGEEVLKAGVDPKKALSYPQYICSQNINDWRYVGEPDGITTMFFSMEFVGQETDILAGDDLDKTEWFDVADLKPGMFEGEHEILFAKLKEKFK